MVGLFETILIVSIDELPTAPLKIKRHRIGVSSKIVKHYNLFFYFLVNSLRSSPSGNGQ